MNPSPAAERFDFFVDRCLYDPDHGFYAQHGQAGGARGDFLTSPELGPLFGRLIGRYLDRVWEDLGRPPRFLVTECGAGRGALAKAVLSSAPACGDALDYVTVERSARLRDAQRDLLGDSVTICSTLAEVADGGLLDGVVIANELLDNLAFRLVVRESDGWSEVFVVDDEPVLADGTSSWFPLPDAAVGARLPLQEQARDWVVDVLDRLRVGRLLIIDYGVATTAELVGRDWLRTYRGHDRGANPFEAPGSCDITADIAFDQLPTATRLCTQAEFLRELGIDELVEEGRRIWAERAHLGDLVAIGARSRGVEAEALLDPRSLGAFIVAEWRQG